MNNFERLIAAVCWFTPGLSLLLLLLWVSTPDGVYRHALWSFLSAAGALAVMIIVSALGAVVLGQEGAAFGVGMLFVVSGAYALAVLTNAVAALAGRGPFFTALVAGGRQRTQ